MRELPCHCRYKIIRLQPVLGISLKPGCPAGYAARADGEAAAKRHLAEQLRAQQARSTP